MERGLAARICRAFSKDFIALIKRAVLISAGLDWDCRSSNTSLSCTAVALRPKANSAAVRRFAFCCRLSHKRNSKHFDRLNSSAALSSHDENPRTDRQISRPTDRIGSKRDRFRSNDDERRGRDVPLSDLLKVVRRIRESRSVSAI